MKKLILASALVAFASTASMADVQHCYQVKGNWVGAPTSQCDVAPSGGGNEKSWLSLHPPQPAPTPAPTA
jgi:hypothetical protein